jgi:hypothetical protein
MSTLYKEVGNISSPRWVLYFLSEVTLTSFVAKSVMYITISNIYDDLLVFNEGVNDLIGINEELDNYPTIYYGNTDIVDKKRFEDNFMKMITTTNGIYQLKNA